MKPITFMYMQMITPFKWTRPLRTSPDKKGKRCWWRISACAVSCLLAASVAVCNSTDDDYANAVAIKESMVNLPRWRADFWAQTGFFNKQDWLKYLEVAGKIQEVDPKIASLALREYKRFSSNESPVDKPEGEADSVPYILLRIVFAIGEDELLKRSFKGWDLPQGGARKLMWPLGYSQQGKIVLAASYTGSRGGAYDGEKEFLEFLRSHKYRDLQKVDFVDQVKNPPDKDFER